MTKRREHDPDLEGLLRAFREVHPSAAEKDQWRAAIANELRSIEIPREVPASAPAGGKIYRFIVRAVLPVSVAASLGFVIGAFVVESRMDAGQAMLFSQTEPSGASPRVAVTMDEEREVVRINLDSGVSE